MARPKSKDNVPSLNTAFRLPLELINRLDAHVLRMREAAPGVSLTRTDAVRSLLYEVLERHEKK